MACSCLENSKEKILAKIAEMHPERTITESDFENRIWCFDGPQDVILTHSFKYEYTFVKTNGTTSIPKNTSININPTYCGFCGKKLVEEKEDINSDTIFEAVRGCNESEALIKKGIKLTVSLHSNDSPNTFDIWRHKSGTKKVIKSNIERDKVIDILGFIEEMYAEVFSDGM